jgi:hypothetical protein
MKLKNAILWAVMAVTVGFYLYIFSPHFGPSGNQYLNINYQTIFLFLAGNVVLLSSAVFLFIKYSNIKRENFKLGRHPAKPRLDLGLRFGPKKGRV